MAHFQPKNIQNFLPSTQLEIMLTLSILSLCYIVFLAFYSMAHGPTNLLTLLDNVITLSLV